MQLKLLILLHLSAALDQWHHSFDVHITFTHFSNCHAFEILSAYKGFADFKSPSVSATFASRKQPDELVTANQPKSGRWVALKSHKEWGDDAWYVFMTVLSGISVTQQSSKSIWAHLVPVRVRSARCGAAASLVGGLIAEALHAWVQSNLPPSVDT